MSRRSWLRISLRALLLLAVIVAIPLAWSANEIQRARRIRGFLEEMKRREVAVLPGSNYVLPASIRYFYPDETMQPKFVQMPDGFELPPKLRPILAELTELEVLELPLAGLTDEDVGYLRGLTKLEYLNLQGNDLSDEAIDHLKQLNNLVRIDLSHNRITGSEFSKLRSLSQLRHINISHNPIPDASCAELFRGRNLEFIDAGKTGFGDLSMQQVAEMTELEGLDARETDVTNAGVALLAKTTKLRSLDLSGTSVDDQVLFAISAFKEIYHLGISGTNVAGPGLGELKNLPKLTNLSLVRTRIDDEAVNRLSELTQVTKLNLSNCNVTPASLPTLAKMKFLQRLSLPMPLISRDQIATLKEQLPSTTVTPTLNDFRDVLVGTPFPGALKSVESGEMTIQEADYPFVRLTFEDGSCVRMLVSRGQQYEWLSDVYLLPDEDQTELRVYRRLPRNEPPARRFYDAILAELRRLKALDIAEPHQQQALKARLGEELGTQTILLWEVWVNFSLPAEKDAVTAWRLYRSRFDGILREDAR